MSNIFLGDQQVMNTGDKGSVLKYEVKIQHLNDLNKKMEKQNEELKESLRRLENMKMQQESYESLFKSFKQELCGLKGKNEVLSKENQKLLTTILINQQLSMETKTQFEFYLGRYEQKIIELRQNLQMKQIQIQTLQQKMQKYKGLNLPLNIKNGNRFTVQILKYESLIQEMIQQRNKNKFSDVKELQNVIRLRPYVENQIKTNDHNRDTKNKSKKPLNGNYQTQIRGNLNTLQNEGVSQTQNKLTYQQMQILFLRLHLQLRQLKRKYKERLEQISQLKTKDKVMKQGYNTITKQMEKIKIQNCQLKIQLDHLDKKIKTSHQISKIKSVNNIKKTVIINENVQNKFLSQASIQANLSDGKNCLKVTLPSSQKNQTFSGHNFDERIENIEGILSLDSNPQFNHRRKINNPILNNQEEQDLSVCQQNEVDVSISLDASGFQMAPQKSHHQISQHILTGLTDNKRIF